MCRRLASQERAGGDLGDFRRQRLVAPQSGDGREHAARAARLWRVPAAHQQSARRSNGTHRWLRRAPWVVRELSPARAMALRRILREVQRDRRKPHDRAVAGRYSDRCCRTMDRRLLEPRECAADRHADIEASAGAAVMAFAIPSNVSLQLIDGIEPLAFDQALREAQSHRGVVGPLPGLPGRTGPPPTMSSIGVEGAGRRNSSVVPNASPTASPSRAPL